MDSWNCICSSRHAVTNVISRTEAVGQRHTTRLSLQVERPSFRLIRSLERETTNHLRSVTGKSCVREMGGASIIADVFD
jgi:hypothetical protein